MALAKAKSGMLGRYAVSGLISFAAEIGLLAALTYVWHLEYLLAISTAFLTTTFIQFVICHAWVFPRSKRNVELEYTYFFLIMLSGLAVTLLLSTFFIRHFSMNVIVARLLSGVIAGLWDYYLNARLNFRAHLFAHSK